MAEAQCPHYKAGDCALRGGTDGEPCAEEGYAEECLEFVSWEARTLRARVAELEAALRTIEVQTRSAFSARWYEAINAHCLDVLAAHAARKEVDGG